MNLSHAQKLVMQRRGEHLVTHLERMRLIYLLGGARFGDRIVGPTGKGDAWSDCSGGAFFVAAAMGLPVIDIFKGHPIWTGSFVDLLQEGESDYLTFHLKEPYETEGHVIFSMRERPKPWHAGEPRYRFAEQGGTDNPHPGGGMTWLPHPGRGMGLSVHERLSEFDYKRCIPGY